MGAREPAENPRLAPPGRNPLSPGSMADSSQIRSLVTLVIEKHGIRAATAAQYEALRARQAGDGERARAWGEVARLVEAELALGLE